MDLLKIPNQQNYTILEGKLGDMAIPWYETRVKISSQIHEHGILWSSLPYMPYQTTRVPNQTCTNFHSYLDTKYYSYRKMSLAPAQESSGFSKTDRKHLIPSEN